jgi:hypothetical protein
LSLLEFQARHAFLKFFLIIEGQLSQDVLLASGPMDEVEQSLGIYSFDHLEIGQQ